MIGKEAGQMGVHVLLEALSKALIAKSVEISTSIYDTPTAPTFILEQTLFRSRILEDISDVLDKVKANI